MYKFTLLWILSPFLMDYGNNAKVALGFSLYGIVFHGFCRIFFVFLDTVVTSLLPSAAGGTRNGTGWPLSSKKRLNVNSGNM